MSSSGWFGSWQANSLHADFREGAVGPGGANEDGGQLCLFLFRSGRNAEPELKPGLGQTLLRPVDCGQIVDRASVSIGTIGIPHVGSRIR